MLVNENYRVPDDTKSFFFFHRKLKHILIAIALIS